MTEATISLHAADGSEIDMPGGVVEIRTLVGQPIIEPPPEPDPPIEPPIDPLPTPPGKPMGHALKLNKSDYFSFADHFRGGSAYTRMQHHVTLKGDTGTLKVVRLDVARRRRFLIDESYVLLCDGQPLANKVIAAEGYYLTFEFPLDGLSDGWHVFDIKDFDCMVFPAFVMKGAEPVQPEWMPVYTASKECSGRKQDYWLDWVPRRFDLIPAPLKHRAYTPFSDSPRKNTVSTEIVPLTTMDVRRPAITADGVWVSENRERYTYDDSHREFPRFPLLDGPRGVGNAHGLLHVRIGRARFENDVPDSPITHNVYALDAWRLMRITREGEITTLVGYRTRKEDHGGRYWEDKAEFELVGDWSAIPEERHGMREPWGFAVDPMSTRTDHSQPPDPMENNQVPHIGSPAFYIADTQNNRVLKVEFNGKQHNLPPKVTEFITDVADPWECVEWQGKLIVSERVSHRIAQYNMQTGELERVIVSGPDLSFVKPAPARWVVRRRQQKANRLPGESSTDARYAALEEIRQHDCVGPEGLYVIDDWLYYGSMAMAQVKRVHLISGAVELVVNVPSHSSTGIKFVKIAVSDGSFGPKGTVFVSQWFNQLPKAYLPGGERWVYGTGTTLAYDASIDVFAGRMVMGGCREGLVEYRLRTDSEPVIDSAKYSRGYEKYRDAGYLVRFGRGGFDPYGQELPYGVDADIDYYLDVKRSD